MIHVKLYYIYLFSVDTCDWPYVLVCLEVRGQFVISSLLSPSGMQGSSLTYQAWLLYTMHGKYPGNISKYKYLNELRMYDIVLCHPKNDIVLKSLISALFICLSLVPSST